MIILQLLLFSFLANAKSTYAALEFECTVIEIFKPQKVGDLLGRSRYPTLSLRRHSSGGFHFTNRKGSMDFDQGSVTIYQDYVGRRISYEIRKNDSTISINLVGTSPSRQGELWQTKGILSPPELLAKVTCH